MSYIIRYSEDTLPAPLYVERLHGFMPPSYTDDPKKARPFASREEAQIYVDKFRAEKDKEGSDSTTIEAIEYGGREEPQLPVPPDENEGQGGSAPRSPYYNKWFGEPRGHFEFGKCRINLYMRKNDNGAMVYGYAFSNSPEKVRAMDEDGAAIITAMCIDAAKTACGLIREFEERRRENG